ncbi:hypothetical protein BABA_11706 [Neobacillus bataviensis LMG 21833]|uniref:Rv2525c-like glycoside hydrolase-like domain-containing protein n=1 Tax=Neobacillus bataviensis LMG 21833 TaxID=1117379 RepID=K6DLP9_9BACI|nr:glycoside hydrolase domain-containing protein [Neobacillus bataviensis]EKN69093.1 hypothetical protein BABA_11706 [Neobacillus bataviensis LMG 21833]
MKNRKWFWNVVLGTVILVLPLLLVFFNSQPTQNATNPPQSIQNESTSQENQSQETSADLQDPPPADSGNQGEQPQADPATQEEEEQPQAEPQQPAPEEKPTIVWGIDTASKIDQAFLQCVKDNYGEPAVFGRYLETKEGISMGLTKEEAALLHEQGAKILPIFNHFTDATGYENGVTEAKEAISYAQKLGIPEGVALFADIEPKYPVDEAFIRGWVETLLASPYKPGIYGILTPDSKLSAAYQAAVSKNKQLQDQTILWSSNPDPGVTPKDQAPAFEPGAPENVNVSIWQYGIDGKTCNIDTNLIQSSVLEALW